MDMLVIVWNTHLLIVSAVRVPSESDSMFTEQNVKPGEYFSMSYLWVSLSVALRTGSGCQHVLTECVLVLWLRGYVFVVGMEGVQTRNQDVGAGGVKWRKAEIVDKSLIFSL